MKCFHTSDEGNEISKGGLLLPIVSGSSKGPGVLHVMDSDLEATVQVTVVTSQSDSFDGSSDPRHSLAQLVRPFECRRFER